MALTAQEVAMVKRLNLKMSDVLYDGSNNVGTVYKLRNDYYYTWGVFNGDFTKHDIFEFLVKRLAIQYYGKG